jgi:hypothetical protein
VTGFSNGVTRVFLRPVLEAFTTSLRTQLLVVLAVSAAVGVAALVVSAVTSRRDEPPRPRLPGRDRPRAPAGPSAS